MNIIGNLGSVTPSNHMLSVPGKPEADKEPYYIIMYTS